VKQVGIAVEHFPNYVHTNRGPQTVDVVLLSFTVKGCGRHIMGAEEYEEDAGSIGITHYGQDHCILTGKEGIEIFNVYLDLRNHPLPPLPAALNDVLASILPLHPHLCHRLNRRVHLRLENPQQTAHLLEKIIYEQDLHDRASDEVIRSALGIFLVELCRSALKYGLVTPFTENEPAEWLERIRLELDTHYREPQTLNQLSRKARIHPSYLCRAFKLYTGRTIMDYLNLRRIQAAMIQLRSTRDKVVQIALECGFNDLTYFNRRFRAVTSMTPTEYRAGNQTEPSAPITIRRTTSPAAANPNAPVTKQAAP